MRFQKIVSLVGFHKKKFRVAGDWKVTSQVHWSTGLFIGNLVSLS